MLTIQNPRRGAHDETGIQIGSFKLVDAGLCNKDGGVGNGSSRDCDSYSFYWNYNDEPRRFKCFLERNPLFNKPTIYNFEIYDEKHKGLDWSLVQSEGLIYAGTVGLANLKDRIGFYTWMTDKIVKHM
jgi:hypothetical protein